LARPLPARLGERSDQSTVLPRCAGAQVPDSLVLRHGSRPTANWSPSPRAIDRLFLRTTGAQPESACSLLQLLGGGPRRGFRLDFHVRGYTNREGYPPFHPPRIASWCLTFIGASTSRQDFRIIMAFPPT